MSFEDLFMHRQLDHRLSRRNQDVIDMSTDSCELCDASFDNANAKIRHFALFHEKVLDLYCISCKKIFKGLNSPWQLKRHEQRHQDTNWIETEHEPFKDRCHILKELMFDGKGGALEPLRGQNQCVLCAFSSDNQDEMTLHLSDCLYRHQECAMTGGRQEDGEQQPFTEKVRTIHDGMAKIIDYCEKSVNNDLDSSFAKVKAQMN